MRHIESARLQSSLWWLHTTPSNSKRRRGPNDLSRILNVVLTTSLVVAVAVQPADERVRPVGLAERVHVGEGVVDQAVAGLVGADDADHVAERGVGGQAPVRARHLGDLGVDELGELALVDQLHDVRVRAHGLLLKVPDEAVHEARVGEVQNEEHGEHHALRHDDRPAEHNAGLADVHERQQVHALVLRLLQQ
eukprot:CAMPEP_0176422448 /NCGR_PEP_ID=MMETSP0127-20121128/9737_1 /TAXON_ID=938130 /ORGANISM="Platyophrya macrostoma, Strain WH" /LENGTH=192 /DNA_ID=CAMNT_0017803295 /DNA_START=280 /DNA_END=855 /DNA_ORIENTATION=-